MNEEYIAGGNHCPYSIAETERRSTHISECCRRSGTRTGSCLSTANGCQRLKKRQTSLLVWGSTRLNGRRCDILLSEFVLEAGIVGPASDNGYKILKTTFPTSFVFVFQTTKLLFTLRSVFPCFILSSRQSSISLHSQSQ
jgi:hypothetical protein